MKKENIKNTNKKITKGFTLIELLVVVVIIGILAAIALPQYKIVMGKTKFAEIKNITKSVLESSNRYFLLHNTYPKKVADLDINLNITYEELNTSFVFKTTEGIECMIWDSGTVACNKKIFGKKVSIYINKEGIPYVCLVFSTDKKDIPNSICKNETGKNPSCQSSYCSYGY